MTITTKANLAAELRISRARISQYCTDGMPTRSDGRLDRETCLNWIKDHVRTTVKRDRGAAMASDITARTAGRTAPAPRQQQAAQQEEVIPPGYEVLRRVDTEFGRGAVAMLLAILHDLPVTTASIAVGAGAPMRAAYAMAPAVMLGVMESATDILKAWDVAPFATEGNEVPYLDPAVIGDVNWTELAALAGEPVDMDAWAAHSAERFGGADED